MARGGKGSCISVVYGYVGGRWLNACRKLANEDREMCTSASADVEVE